MPRSTTLAANLPREAALNRQVPGSILGGFSLSRSRSLWPGAKAENPAVERSPAYSAQPQPRVQTTALSQVLANNE